MCLHVANASDQRIRDLEFLLYSFLSIALSKAQPSLNKLEGGIVNKQNAVGTGTRE